MLCGVSFFLSLGACTSGPQVPLEAQLINSRATKVSGINAPQVGAEGVSFALESPEAIFVTIAGQFNGWDPKATPLSKDSEGIWRITLPLKPGKHRYKFTVDGIWLPDPHNKEFEADGFGHYNSLVVVPK